MKILIIRLSSLGDIILTQPVCALLKKAYPQAELTFLTKKQYAALPEMFDLPVNVLTYEKSLGFHKYLRTCRYDLVIDLHAKFSSILASYCVQTLKRVRYSKLHKVRQRIVHGDRKLTIESTVSLYVSALKKLGLSTQWQYPALKAPDMPSFNLSNDTTCQIAIIPGATHFTKRYPTEQWKEFINANPDWEFHLFGSSADSAVCASIISKSQVKCSDHSGKMSLKELSQALAQCDLVLSGDTGPMHLAAALSKPQIAIFGATHPRLGFQPLNSKAKVLCADLPCQPCHLHGSDKCPLGHFKCMKEITPQMLGDLARSSITIRD